MPGFNDHDEFMAIQQLTQGPFNDLPDPRQCLKRLFMIDWKSSIRARNKTTTVFRMEERTPQLSILYTVHRQSFYYRLSIVFNETEGDSVDRTW